VEPTALTEEDWWRFWAYEVTPQEISRHWLRPAVFYLQAARRPTPGVAGDLALTTHLVDVDVFVTSDGPFFEILEKVTAAAPFATARPMRVLEIDDLSDRLS